MLVPLRTAKDALGRADRRLLHSKRKEPTLMLELAEERRAGRRRMTRDSQPVAKKAEVGGSRHKALLYRVIWSYFIANPDYVSIARRTQSLPALKLSPVQQLSTVSPFLALACVKSIRASCLLHTFA